MTTVWKKHKLKEKTQLMSVKSIMAYECIKSEVSQEEAVSANHAKLYETWEFRPNLTVSWVHGSELFFWKLRNYKQVWTHEI